MEFIGKLVWFFLTFKGRLERRNGVVEKLKDFRGINDLGVIRAGQGREL